MKFSFRIFTLTLFIGLFAIIGFGFNVVHTASTTEASITTDSHERGSPATAQPLYSNLEIRIFDGTTTIETAIHATSPAALWFNNNANLIVTADDTIDTNKVNYVLTGNSYRYVNYLKGEAFPTPTDIPAALSASYTFSEAVFVTVGRKELASSSFL